MCQQGLNQRNKARSDYGVLARAARKAASTRNPKHEAEALRLKAEIQETKRLLADHVSRCITCSTSSDNTI